MIATRPSGAKQRNRAVTEVTRAPKGNAAFYAQQAAPGSVVLIGGSNVVHFRQRVAQSHLRYDLLPSFWSLAGLVETKTSFLSVPVGFPMEPDEVPSRNAIVECAIADFDDADLFPNIAVISFAAGAKVLVEYARQLRYQRGAVDLPSMLSAWLAFVWGAGSAGNPLMQNIGIPSSALIETVYGIGGIELTPGVASASSCPEAIWQSALWWHEYYGTIAAAPAGAKARRRSDRTALMSKVPEGRYITRQRAAAVTEEAAK